jgi:hypothetical protein
MLTYLFSLLMLDRLGLGRPLRILITVFLIGLVIVVLLYTAYLFLTLSERTGTHHVLTNALR